jgi:very-short-patch-repair endonuclease
VRLDPHIKENARELRRHMSPAEKILWRELRGRRFEGFRFRRQHPLGEYVLDFYCADAKLALEIDGESHLDQSRSDARRTKWIESQGIRVERFWNTHKFDELETVKDRIWQLLTNSRRSE